MCISHSKCDKKNGDEKSKGFGLFQEKDKKRAKRKRQALLVSLCYLVVRSNRVSEKLFQHQHKYVKSLA